MFGLLGGLLGVAGGWTLAHVLVKVLTGVFDPPPAGLAVPWGYLGLVALCSGAAQQLARQLLSGCLEHRAIGFAQHFPAAPVGGKHRDFSDGVPQHHVLHADRTDARAGERRFVRRQWMSPPVNASRARVLAFAR